MYFIHKEESYEFSNSKSEGLSASGGNFVFIKVLAESSNGRTTPFGGVCRGSNPLSAA